MKCLKGVCFVGLLFVLSFGMYLSAAAEDKVSITIARVQPNGEENKFMDSVVNDYMKEHPDVEVKWLYGPRSVTSFMGLCLQFFEAESSEVDAFVVDVTWPGDLADNLLDLSKYEGVKELTDDYFPAIVQNNTVNDRLVAMPWYTDAGLLFYRTDLLQKYGYDEPPKTWMQLEEMAKKIQDGERKENPDFWGFVWQGNASESLTCDALEWIKSSGGGSIVEPDGTISVDSDETVASLERAASWVGTITPPGVTGFIEEDARRVWQGGNAAFMRNWPYAYYLGEKEDSVIKGKFDIAPLPGAEEGMSAGTLGGWQIGVSKYSKHPEIAADVVKYLTSRRVQKRMAIDLGKLPTLTGLYQDQEVLEARPFMERLYDVFTNAVARPSTATSPKYNQVSTLVFTSVHDVLTKKKNAQAAVEELALDLSELLE